MSKKNNKKPEIVDDEINHTGDMDPVEEEVVFMISQQKVVEVDKPVEVIIGSNNPNESDSGTTQNEVSDSDMEPDVDVEPEVETDPEDVVIIGDIINNRKNPDEATENTEDNRKPKESDNTDYFNPFRFMADRFKKLHEDVEDACRKTREDNERILRESRAADIG